jgi:hypothetical protein
VFSSVFQLGLAENEEIARDGLAGNGDPQLGLEFAGGSRVTGCFDVARASRWFGYLFGFIWCF